MASKTKKGLTADEAQAMRAEAERFAAAEVARHTGAGEDEPKRPAAARIASALGAMPYGALASDRAGISHGSHYVKRSGPERKTELDMDRLADFIEALRDVLQEHAATAHADRQRLIDVEAQLSAVGDVLARALPAKRMAAILGDRQAKREGRHA